MGSIPAGSTKPAPLLNAGARAWYFNRGGPAARSAAVRPDAVGTRAQPEVFPPGVPSPRPCSMQGRGLGISIGEDLPHGVRRFAPTQSARGRSPKYSRREYHFDHKILWSFSFLPQYLGKIFQNWYKNRVIPENFTIQQKGMTSKAIPFTLSGGSKRSPRCPAYQG